MIHWSKKREAVARVDAARMIGFRAGIDDLMGYLMSEKFQDDTTVQVQDVLNRIQTAHQMMNDFETSQMEIEALNGNL